MLSSNLRCDQIQQCHRSSFGLTLLCYSGWSWMFNKPTAGTGSLNKSSCLAPTLGVTKYIMRLCQPPDGNTSPKYKLLCFITTIFFCKEKNTLAFNRDRCCHLVLCLRLIPFHCNIQYVGHTLLCYLSRNQSFNKLTSGLPPCQSNGSFTRGLYFAVSQCIMLVA